MTLDNAGPAATAGSTSRVHEPAHALATAADTTISDPPDTPDPTYRTEVGAESDPIEEFDESEEIDETDPDAVDLARSFCRPSDPVDDPAFRPIPSFEAAGMLSDAKRDAIEVCAAIREHIERARAYSEAIHTARAIMGDLKRHRGDAVREALGRVSAQYIARRSGISTSRVYAISRHE